ncbi:hypothetical protein JW859_14790 [bacterium]|nr:hypothetical protein [bacterium]
MSPAILQSLLDPSIIWIFIPLTALAIPIVAILTHPMTARMKQAERKEARQLYERIVMEKLDVMKTALAMGMNNDELAELDRRLERLVGASYIKSLLLNQPEVPIADSTDLLDADLDSEMRRMKERRETE